MYLVIRHEIKMCPPLLKTRLKILISVQLFVLPLKMDNKKNIRK